MSTNFGGGKREGESGKGGYYVVGERFGGERRKVIARKGSKGGNPVRPDWKLVGRSDL